MHKQFLLPHKYKKVGWKGLFFGLIVVVISILFLSTLLLSSGFFRAAFENKEPNLNELETNLLKGGAFLLALGAICLILGAAVTALSKEKIEDEYIQKLRHASFLYAIFYNYILLLLYFFIVSEPSFLNFFKWSPFNVLLMYVFDFHIRLNYPDYWEKLGDETKNLFKNAK